MKSYSIVSMKGGVGKTTLTVNLGAALSEAGKQVLLIDLDPQHDLTQSMGIEPLKIKGLEFLLEGDLMFEAVMQPYNKNLHLLPAGKKLKDLELSLSDMFVKIKDRYFCYLLKNALEVHKESYDYILIDCPPTAGFLTINALSFSPNVIVPVQCQYLGLEASKKTMFLISKVKRFSNPEVKTSAVVPTMFDVRNRLSNMVIDKLSALFNGALTNTKIRVNTDLAEAPAFGKTIFDYKPQSHGADDFRELAKEISSHSIFYEDEIREK